MRSYRMRLLIYLILLPSNFVFSQNWYQLEPYPSTEIDDGIYFQIDNYTYCGTGQTPWWSSLGSFYKLNMLTDTWTTATPLPGGKERFYANGFSYNGFGFVFGGYKSGVFLNDLWIYDPISDSWSEGDTLPSFGRSGAAQFQIDSFAYVVGGTSTFNRLSEVWRLNLNSLVWEQMGDLPFGKRWRGSACSKNGKGYLTFGRDNADIFYNELYEYDPLLDNWTAIDTFPSIGRSHASMINCANEIYILAGIDSNDVCYEDLWHYSTSTNIWAQLASIPIDDGIRGGICFSSTNSIYFTTGIDQNNNRHRTTWKIGYPLNTKEIMDKPRLSIFPNPNKGVLHVVSLSEEILFIGSTEGKILEELSVHSGAQVFDLSHLDPGIYLVYSENSAFFERLIIYEGM